MHACMPHYLFLAQLLHSLITVNILYLIHIQYTQWCTSITIITVSYVNAKQNTWGVKNYKAKKNQQLKFWLSIKAKKFVKNQQLIALISVKAKKIS